MTKRRTLPYYWAAAVVILSVAALWSIALEIIQQKICSRHIVHALPLLLAMCERNADDDLLPLCIGNCYLNVGIHQQAIAAFKESTLSNDNIARQTSRWYLALSYLAAAKTAESVILLRNIEEK